MNSLGNSTVLVVLLLLVLATTAAESWLDLLNLAEVKRRAGRPPSFVPEMLDGATYERSMSYTLAKGKFGLVVRAGETLLTIALITTPLLGQSYQLVHAWLGSGIVGQVGYLVLFAWAVGLVHLPSAYWAQFVIEERFGFNRSGRGLWIADRCKGFLLATALGVPLAAAMVALIRWLGSSWWVWGSFLIVGVQVFVATIFPRFILPLFNKLTPLPEGSLRQRLLELTTRTNFRVASIYVMDGSKRSTHSNAFFAGLGSFRRIVLFDTLVGSTTEAELESVLAHEIGHSKLGHIRRSLLFGAATNFAVFALAGWLLRANWLLPAFGLPRDALGPALLLIAWLVGVVGFWLTPVGSWLSRRHEYDADAFARSATGSAEPLVAALRKLARANLSNLTPHPWFVWFYYSHPTLAQREAALQLRC